MRYNSKLSQLGVILAVPAVSAPTAKGQPIAAATTASPVAYVYVSNYLGTSGTTEVQAYASSPSGALTSVPGAPFDDEVTYLAVNGKYLMGATDNGININAYDIQNNGALSFSAQTNVVTQNSGCGSAGPFVFDHTGASLYNFSYAAKICANNTYESFNVVKATGKLTFLGDAGDGEGLNGLITFIGNNVYAYGSTCYHSTPTINSFKRSGTGLLTQLNIAVPYPPSPSETAYCPFLAAADPSNHVVIPMQLYNGYLSPYKPYQLAVYTAGTNGALTTTSTYSNMPFVSVGDVNDVKMAPSGKLVAVAGMNGLQIFHVNGANPITEYLVLDSTDNVGECFWDNTNHLYAISQGAGKLFVYTVTPTTHGAAPGSPHAIHEPIHLIVQPWPRY
jgi:hypothetical protein